MTIFTEKLDEETLTTAEAKELLAEIEADYAATDRDMNFNLKRAIEHVNRFAVLDAEESRELVMELLELEKVDESTAVKIVDLLPQDRDELRAIYAQERFTLSGDELDEILNLVAKYA
ncbi:RNA polymerase Rpb4 family protein [Haladaptatus halobius]|uniref:RNA polymerase Rpb4 family protein n=1 Tax=Haladaptatus halobius TaxID=2884875 RepID=UPI001D0A5650|nr:RNA polymerase Rpb4 family protein [Haladaptatus halobius]